MDHDGTSKAERVRDALARFQGPLIRYARQLIGDLEAARDVVQDTFLKLCSEEAALAEDHLPRWLYTVCRNRALDVRKKEGRMKPVDDQAIDRIAAPGPPPPNQREVVRLKFQGGLSYKEISQVTGLSVSNVGFLLHQAIRTIRGKIDAK